MLILLSPAKTMRADASENCTATLTEPRFLSQAQHIVEQMLPYSVEELESIFKISSPLAQELALRFRAHHEGSSSLNPTIEAYDGVVLKHMKGESNLTREQYEHLQKHTIFCSMLYGLLRPLDAIAPYRMESALKLPKESMRVDRMWRDILTPTLIDDVEKAGGTLVYLASKEEQQAFHWKKVEAAVRVVYTSFLQRKAGKLRQVVVYTKMARGEMLRFMLDEGISDAEELKRFAWHGYHFAPELSSENDWVWVKDV